MRFVWCVAATIGRLNFESQPEPLGLLLSAFIGDPLFIIVPLLLPFIMDPLFVVPFAHGIVPVALALVDVPVFTLLVVLVPFVVVVAFGIVAEFGIAGLPGGIMLLQSVAGGAVFGHWTVVPFVLLAAAGVWDVVVPGPDGFVCVTGVPGTVFSVEVSEFTPVVTVPVPFGLQ